MPPHPGDLLRPQSLRNALTYETLGQCPVCQNTAIEDAFSKRDEFFDLEFQLQRCKCCTAVFVNPRIDRKHLAELYASDYFKGESWDSDTNYLSNYDRPARLAELKRMYLRYYDQIRGKLKSSNPRVLDAGAGLGLFSQTVLEHFPNAQVVSLDPSEYAVRHMQALGLNAVHSDLESYRTETPFDAVFMREVLEHLYYPKNAVKNIANQLRPGGVFYYTTGNTDEIDDLEAWGYVRPVGHIVYYNHKSVTHLLRQCGLFPYPRELIRIGFRKRLSGRLKWLMAHCRLRTGELPVGIRCPQSN